MCLAFPKHTVDCTDEMPRPEGGTRKDSWAGHSEISMTLSGEGLALSTTHTVNEDQRPGSRGTAGWPPDSCRAALTL